MITLTPSALQQSRTAVLLDRIAGAGSVRLAVDQPFRLDPVRTLLFFGALSHLEGHLRGEVRYGSSTDLKASLHSSLIGPLFWPEQDYQVPVETPFNRLELRRTTVASGLYACSTASIGATTPEEFVTFIKEAATEARIPGTTYARGALGRLAFEAATNAEEHGYLKPDGTKTHFRVFVLQHLPRRRRPWAGKAADRLAETYLTEYRRNLDPPSLGWLQLLICDAGAGLAFPSYRVLSQAAGWPPSRSNVYQEHVAVEQERLDKVLNHRMTTKGSYGRVRNRFTKPGFGLREIQLSLGFSRGYASVRAGRLQASWSYPKAGFADIDQRSMAPYTVSRGDGTLYLGTIWRALLPLSEQTEMSIGAR